MLAVILLSGLHRHWSQKFPFQAGMLISGEINTFVQ